MSPSPSHYLALLAAGVASLEDSSQVTEGGQGSVAARERNGWFESRVRPTSATVSLGGAGWWMCGSGTTLSGRLACCAPCVCVRAPGVAWVVCRALGGYGMVAEVCEYIKMVRGSRPFACPGYRVSSNFGCKSPHSTLPPRLLMPGPFKLAGGGGGTTRSQ